MVEGLAMSTNRMFGKSVVRWLRLAVLAFATAGLASVGAMASYTVSGHVYVCGVGTSGITVKATSKNQTTQWATTNTVGLYTFNNLTTGKTYTITCTTAGYTYTPSSQTVSSAATNVNFSAVKLITISGTITACNGLGNSGVTVSTNTGLSATTNASGAYTINNVPGGCSGSPVTYTITPSKSGFTYTPASQPVTVTNVNASGVNFSANAPNISISGTITLCDGSGLSGVTVTADTGQSATTNSSGDYTINALPGSCTGISYTLTPSLSGYTFSPSSLSVSVLTSSVSGKNFAATSTPLPSISGSITTCDGSGISGVTVSTDTGQSAVTGSGGAYIITGLTPCATYTVTPVLSGYTFVPSNQTVVLAMTNQANINFHQTPPSGTISISGTVTNPDGSGLVGVAVSTDQGQLANTGSGGAYTITGLSPCMTYTVTPYKSGYYFSPGSQALRAGSSNVTGISFTAYNIALGGWDPLRQIQKQIIRPNLLIVQDVSGSMTQDINAKDVGIDSTGTSPTAAWGSGQSGCSDPSSPCTTWSYTLTITQTFPSRIATVKNALGNSVSIITPWTPPDVWTTDTSYSYIKGITGTKWTGTITGPTVVHSASTHKYTWTVTFATAQVDPGIPFKAYSTSGGAPTVGGGAVSLAPQDLIGKTANKVNWGLETFSDTTSSLIVPIDSNDTGVVTDIENQMRLYSNGGLNVGGATPTRTALTDAGTNLASVYSSDPKKTCGRTYGVVLVTDGLSNQGNKGVYNNKNWISPCGNCPGESCCDVGSSGYNCPDNYTDFPAGAAENLWNMTAPANIRTWAIGISAEVNRCEMNMDAYMGRTDASSPNGDAGFNTANDPYLPTSTGDMGHYLPNSSGHGDYAYFATTAQALNAAFSTIVAAAASGDYSTAAPVVSSNIAGGSDVAYLASAGYPDWNGHLYAYDVHDPATPALNWDAGDKLTVSKRDITSKPRVIYTWDSSNNIVNIGAYSDVSSLSTLSLPAGFTNRVLDYVKGYDGTLSNVQRSWILGPILDSTAAVLSAPEAWKPGSGLPDHKDFETTYASRHALVVVGSSDGMLHVFDVADGYEVYAILPPDQLANQVLLYNNYMASAGQRVTGEPLDLSSHIYGVASSPRFADVYLTSDSKYHTVLFLTEGRGGKTLAAIDVTHSYPGRNGVSVPGQTSLQNYAKDVNCDIAGAPNYTSLISVIWSQNSSTLSGLGQTWSVPAVGATSSSNFDCILGSGFGGSTSYTPSVLRLNAKDGSVYVNSSLSNASSPLVNNQSYGAGALYNSQDSNPQVYHLQDLGVVSDTNGRIWVVVPSTNQVVKEIDVGATQPIYYTPAVAYYNGKDIYAFSSGNFYEMSSAITGASSTFTPKLYIVVKSPNSTAANPAKDIYSVNLTDIVVNAATNAKLGSHSQVSADPVLFIPSSAGLPVKAFFLVYDPDVGTCVGTSYLIELDTNVVAGADWNKSVTTTSTSLGEGVASGFAFSGGKIIVARSQVGSGHGTVAPQVAGTGPTPLGEAPALSSWIELR
jgi:hypothetical protein